MKHGGTENEIEFSALYDEEMIMKKTKLTVIVDNIPQGDIKGEWGLSILVEYEDLKTPQGYTFFCEGHH